MVTTASSGSFSYVDNTYMHPLPDEKKGNFVGNALIATGNTIDKVSKVVGYIPGGESVEALSKFAIVTPVTVMGNVFNFDLKGARHDAAFHITEGSITAVKATTPGSGAVDWVSGKLSNDGLRISDRIVATVEDVYSPSGAPDKGPSSTPSNGSSKNGNIHTA